MKEGKCTLIHTSLLSRINQVDIMSSDDQMEVPKGSSSKSSNGNCKIQLKAYAKVDVNPLERDRGIPVMVDIMALSGMEEQHPRMPMDLVIVFHVRKGCNVPKNWEKLLMKALDIVVKRLDKNDRVAVVPVQPFFKNKVDSTVLCSNVQSIKSDTSLVRAMESAESILYGREHKDKERRRGHIIVISNSNDGLDSLLVWRFRSVHAFGFRDAHNPRTMHAISISRGCTYAILDDERGHVTQAFIACINRITSTITRMHIEVKLKCDQNVVLIGIETPGINYFISNDKKVGIIWPSAHVAGAASSKFVVYIRYCHRGDLPKLFTVDVKCGNVSNKLDVQVVTKGTDGSREVAAEMMRIEALKIVAGMVAEDKNDMEQLHGAADDLQKRWTKLLEHSDYGREAAECGLISSLTRDMQEMEIRLYNNYFWLEYMLSWQSHQRWQLPLPQLFMDNDPRMRARVLAKVDGVPGTITEDNQKGLPVLVQLMAPEAMLATVKRAPVDLIVVLDATYGPSEMERKKQKMLEILMKARDIAEQHNEAKKVEKKLQEKMKPLDKAKEEKERKIRAINERLNLPTNVKKIFNKICKTCSLANEMTEKLKGKLEEKLDMLDEALNKEEPKWLEMKDKITQKRLEMNSLLEERNELHNQAKEVEKELVKVMEDTRKRMELLIKAMDLVMMKLGDMDHLAIVPVQSSVNDLATGLLDMSKQGQSQTHTKVHSFVDLIDRTLMTILGNSKATQTWSEQQKKDIIAAPLILTSSESEGTPSMTSHTADVDRSTKMRKALMDAGKILDDRQGEEKERMGIIIVISDSDDESICLESLSTNYTMHAFGFSDSHNSRAMYHVANSCNGIYDILNDGHNQITEAFRVCIEKITSTIAVDTEIKIMCSDSSSVVLSNIECGQFRHFIDHDRKYSSIFVSALYAGAARNFISYVDNVREDSYDSFAKLFTVHVKWLHALSRVENRLDGQVVTFKKGSDESKEVEENIAYVEVVKIVSSITDPNYNKKVVANNLQKMYQKCLKYAGDVGEDFLTRDMMKIKSNLLADKLTYILSWLSYHRKSEQAPLPQPVA